MPWWLLGVSMVACTFSCDTPNLITEIVRLNGVAGNWVWWAFLLTGMLTVFVYAGLWRRSGLDTDLGFYELRYSGRPAAFLRGFRAVYLGVVYNLIILGGVSLAAIKIGQIMFGLSPGLSLLFSMTGVAVYATLGGLTGSMWADFYQFSVAMAGAIFAAVYAVNSGMAEGVTSLSQLFAHPAVSPKLSLVQPATHDLSTLMTVLILPLAVQWWNVWYPGAEPGGGGFVAQRMLSARNERHAVGGTLLFNVLHYIAAYMSTVATLLNWGSSYVVQDVYLRFFRPQASARHAVRVGRVTMLAMLLVSAAIAFHMTTVKTIFHVLLQVGAGTGLLYILRWFWWRINVWSEVTAMAVSFAVAVFFQFAAAPLGIEAALARAGWLRVMDVTSWKMVFGILITTAAWLTATYLTPPVDDRTLADFCRKIRPGGPGWRRFETAQDGAAPQGWSVPNGLLCMLLGCLLVWASLFGVGYLLYGAALRGAVLLAVAAAAGWCLLRRVTARA
jgi:Na+/proline symporter